MEALKFVGKVFAAQMFLGVVGKGLKALAEEIEQTKKEKALRAPKTQ